MASAAKLDQQHPDYKRLCPEWQLIDLLYQGGAAIKEQASLFIAKRFREPAYQYTERLDIFTYQNVMGSALGWYPSKLFRDDVSILFGDKKPETPEWNAFFEDADRSGNNFKEYLRQVSEHLLLFQHAWVLTDKPKPVPVSNRKEQIESGQLQPYLVTYHPMQVINWRCDRFGNVEWAVVKTTESRQRFQSEPEKVETWYYFDRVKFETYERVTEDGKTPSDEVALKDEGEHALTAVGRCPLRRICVPSSLWLASHCYLQACERVRDENAYAWAVYNDCLAFLVVNSDSDVTITKGETSYVQIPKDSTLSYCERGTGTLDAMAAKCDKLREEIYRSLCLMSQGRDSSATPAVQSGVAKEVEMSTAQDVLEALGDTMRPAVSSIIWDVQDAMGASSDEEIQVVGFNFSPDVTAEEVKVAADILAMNMGSETLEKTMKKRLARQALRDELPSVHDTVDKEIDAAPTDEEREKELRDEEAAAMEARFAGSMKGKI